MSYIAQVLEGAPDTASNQGPRTISGKREALWCFIQCLWLLV